MRIATWNMGRAEGAWDYLLDIIKPDFALLQETFNPEGRPGHVKWDAIGDGSLKYGPKANYRWGSAVWSRQHELNEVPVGVPGGWVKAARPVRGESLTLISVHVEVDREKRSIPILHKILSDLTPTLLQTRLKVILGGDLNADVWFDDQYGVRRHAIAFERIEDFGLWHCNRMIAPGKRQTYRKQAPVMDDHLFVRRSMSNRVVSCEVLADDACPSDHFPVVLELTRPRES